MGNICDCMNSSKSESFDACLAKESVLTINHSVLLVEQEYTPIETVEVSQPSAKPVQKSGNNYQSIIDRASG